MSESEQNVINYLKNMENRITVLEDTVITLLIALRDGGIIVDSDDESDKQQYMFNLDREDD